MALVNNPYVYTGGNVVFDNSRGLDLMAKLQAQERAKLDAVDEYVRGLNTKITPKGMRRVDEPVFNEKYKAWVELGKDRKKLLDPNVRAQFDIAGQELLNFVEESKATEERKKPFVELLIDPNKAKQLRPDVFGMVKKHDQPLYIKDEQGNFVKNPQRADIDYTSKLFKAPEFDFNKKIGEWSKGISAGEVVEFDKGVVNSQTAEVYYPVKEKYSKDQSIQIGLNAGRGVADDEDALMYYNDRLRTLPKSEYDRLNKIFQDKFGETREVKLPNGQVVKERNYITDERPETLAMAEAADWAEKFVGKESMKAKSDFERKQQAQLNKIYIQDSLIRNRKPIDDESVSGNALDELPDRKLSSGGRFEGGVVYDKNNNLYNGNVEMSYTELPASVVSALGAVKVRLRTNKPITAKVVNGQVVSIKQEGGNEVSRQFMENAQKKLDTERKGDGMGFGNPPPQLPKLKPNTPQSTFVFPNGKTKF